MKKLNYLWMLGLLMFAAINFASCSDDDDAPGASSDLVGLWESVSYEGWEKYRGELYDEWDEMDNDSRIKFNADGTWVDYEYYDGEWDLSDTGTWEYKNGKLYSTYDNEEYEEEAVDQMTVKELTASKLVLEFHEIEDEWEYYELVTMKKIN